MICTTMMHAYLMHLVIMKHLIRLYFEVPAASSPGCIEGGREHSLGYVRGCEFHLQNQVTPTRYDIGSNA